MKQNIEKKLKGKVYWSNVRSGTNEKGESTASGVAYFEDLNQVMMDDWAFSFARDPAGEGYVLERKDTRPSSAKSPQEQQQEKAMLQMLKPMLANAEMRVKVVMPGAVSRLSAGSGL